MSIEQMKHLQELGVDTSDASMVWVKQEPSQNSDDEFVSWKVFVFKDWMKYYIVAETFILTYTIGDLIEKLPKDVRNYDLEIHCDFKCLGYAAASDFEYSIEYDRLIDGLYDLLCWVAENHKELLEVKK